MTDIQKQTIVAMRSRNATYAAIAEAVGIPANTVKTFCRRNGITTAPHTEKSHCKNCGVELTNTPKARAKVFCSVRCKQAWWNKHRWERVSAKLVSHTCPTCGKVFIDYSGAHRKFCSQKCYRERGGTDA